jgi:hypothetical protein
MLCRRKVDHADLKAKEISMHRKLALATGLLAAMITATPLAVSAATTAPMTSTTQVGNSYLQLAQYDGWRYRDRRWRDDGGWRHCRVWRHRCADRWGWGGWEFRRCLWRHGCGGHGHRY